MRPLFPVLLYLSLLTPFLALPPAAAQEVLRGEVRVDLEPIYGAYVDSEYPLSPGAARRRALEEAALFYSAMIYGWSFSYEIGERARGIAEDFRLEAQGTIPFGDPGLYATDARVEDLRFYLWTDYRLSGAQMRRVTAWKTGTKRSAQATGYGPLGDPGEEPDWLAVKQTALEDAARSSVRALLRGSERNRPKEARGFISLAAFPRYFMSGGRWAVSARFLIDLTELVPFAAY
jgi:hypothetical protein